MTNEMMCSLCKLIPAGFSKRTNKPYDAFYTCEDPECPNYKPLQKSYAPKSQPIGNNDVMGKRFTGMAQYLAREFKTINTKLDAITKKLEG